MYLKHINLVNFQSWRDLTIDLSDGLNVIVADNGVGKSVIFKALEFAINPYKFTVSQWSDFIRYDEEQAVISLVFSDDSGYVITITRKNVYYTRVTDLSGESVIENLGGVSPQDLADKLGSVIKNDVISNFISMDGTKFLVNSDYDTNHSLLSLTINDEELDYVIDTLETNFIPKNKSLQKEINQKLSFLSQSLNTIKRVDCEAQKQNLEFCASLILSLSPLLDIRDDFSRIKPTVELYPSTEDLYNFSVNLECINNELKRLHKVPSRIPSGIVLYHSAVVLNDFKESLSRIKNLPEISTVDKDVLLYNDCLKVYNLNNYLKSVKDVRIEDSTKLLFNTALKLSNIFTVINRSFSTVNQLSEELSDLEYEMNELGGEEYECPVHGKILYLHGECIPSLNR